MKVGLDQLSDVVLVADSVSWPSSYLEKTKMSYCVLCEGGGHLPAASCLSASYSLRESSRTCSRSLSLSACC